MPIASHTHDIPWKIIIPSSGCPQVAPMKFSVQEAEGFCFCEDQTQPDIG